MSLNDTVFFLLSLLILVSGFLAVTSRKIFRSAIYLLFSLIGIAGIYFWLDYEFIAAVQIVVYVGGIVVLIIFSIFLTQQAGADLPKPQSGRIIFSALAVLSGFGFTWWLVSENKFLPSVQPPVEANILSIGKQMLGTDQHGYALPFEVVSVLLLAAMIGCIVIAMKSKSTES